jgi:hypothetical protein
LEYPSIFRILEAVWKFPERAFGKSSFWKSSTLFG